MSADDLNEPLGQDTKSKTSFTLPGIVPRIAVGVLGLFVTVFVVWAAVVKDPLGGEPTAIVAALPATEEAPKIVAGPRAGPGRYDGPGQAEAAESKTAPGSQTITIIDGSSGKRHEVVVPGSGTAKNIGDPRLLEKSRHGLLPKIAADGTRPSEAYARKAAAGGNKDAPRIALIVGGLGISTSATSDVLDKLPGTVTLAFTPYGHDLVSLVERARSADREVLLQVPMEPFDYPDNDPGPQTLLSTLSGEQNVDRLQWLMSRFQGYVGIMNMMGARFTASEPAIVPVLREVSKRGLIYVDDGSSPRGLASQIAGANKLPFAKADVIIDAVPTSTDIDKALVRLETLARERGSAVGYASALPITIERAARWAESLAGRGITLVPITAIAVKAKSS